MGILTTVTRIATTHTWVRSAKGNVQCADRPNCEDAGYLAFPARIDLCRKKDVAAIVDLWLDTKDHTKTAIQSCCGMTHVYVGDGIAFDGASTLDTSGVTFSSTAPTVALAAAYSADFVLSLVGLGRLISIFMLRRRSRQ